MMLLAPLICFPMSTTTIVATGPEMFPHATYSTTSAEPVLPSVMRVLQSFFNGYSFENRGGVQLFVEDGGIMQFCHFMNRVNARAHVEGEGDLNVDTSGVLYNSFRAELHVHCQGNSLLRVFMNETIDMTNDGLVILDSRGSLYFDSGKTLINRGTILLLAAEKAC